MPLRDRNDRDRLAPPARHEFDGVTYFGVVQCPRKRCRPCDASGRRVGFVFADDCHCAFRPAAANRNACTETHNFRRGSDATTCMLACRECQ